MTKFLEKLISVGSAGLLPVAPVIDFPVVSAVAKELLGLLEKKNGLYAFGSALHIFPAQSLGGKIGLDSWNSPELWSQEYEGMADDALFFAEDIFGGQFCIKQNEIYSFDPETAEYGFLASDLEGWAKLILDDYDFMTGYPLAKEWQELRGPLAEGRRLVPKTPFVLGGEFTTENLQALESVKSMRLRANLALQIRDLPDGEQIRWEITD